MRVAASIGLRPVLFAALLLLCALQPTAAVNTAVYTQDGYGFGVRINPLPMAPNGSVAMSRVPVADLPGDAFRSACFDGHDVFYVPYNADFVLRVNAHNASYQRRYTDFVANVYTPAPGAFRSAVCTGDYVWLVPARATVMYRLNKHTGVMDPMRSWPQQLGLNNDADPAFVGAAYDGTYLWACPHAATMVVRVDADGDMTGFNDWPTAIAPRTASSFSGIVYNGRSVFLVPNDAACIVRVDRNGAMACWGTWPPGTRGTDWPGRFRGGFLDGKYLVLAPLGGGAVVRAHMSTGVMHAIALAPSDTTMLGTTDGRYYWFVHYTDASELVRVDAVSREVRRLPIDVAGVARGNDQFRSVVCTGSGLHILPLQSPAVVQVTWEADASVMPNGLPTAQPVDPGSIEMTEYAMYTANTQLLAAGAAAAGRYVFVAPNTAPYVGRIDRETGDVALLEFPLGHVTAGNQYGAPASTGDRVWLPPADNADLVSIDAVTSAITIHTGVLAQAGVDTTVEKKFHSAIVGGGYVWLLPSALYHLVRIHPHNVSGALRVPMFPDNVATDAGATAGGVFAVEAIWMVPRSVACILRIDVATLQSKCVSGGGAWPTAVTNPDYAAGAFDGTHIFFVPRNAQHILLLRTDTERLSTLEVAGMPSVPALAFSRVFFDGQRLLVTPRNAGRIITVDTATYEMRHYTAWPSHVYPDRTQFAGACFDGTALWLAPKNIKSIVRVQFSASADSARVVVPVTSAYSSGQAVAVTPPAGGFAVHPVRLPASWPALRPGPALVGGRLYLLGRSDSRVYSIHATRYDAAEHAVLPHAAVGAGDQPAFAGVAVARDGTVWFAPYMATAVVRYDPATDTAVGYDAWPTAVPATRSLKFRGAAEDDDGHVWMCPYSAAAVLRVRTRDGAMTAFDDFPTAVGVATEQRYAGTMYAAGSVWCVPHRADCVLEVHTANGSMTCHELPTEHRTKPMFGGGAFDGTRIHLMPHNAAAPVSIDVHTKALRTYRWPRDYQRPGDAIFSDALFDGRHVWALPSKVGGDVFRIDVRSGEVTLAAGLGTQLAAATGTCDGDSLWVQPLAGKALYRVTWNTARGATLVSQDGVSSSGRVFARPAPRAVRLRVGPAVASGHKYAGGCYDGARNVTMVPYSHNFMLTASAVQPYNATSQVGPLLNSGAGNFWGCGYDGDQYIPGPHNRDVDVLVKVNAVTGATHRRHDPWPADLNIDGPWSFTGVAMGKDDVAWFAPYSADKLVRAPRSGPPLSHSPWPSNYAKQGSAFAGIVYDSLRTATWLIPFNANWVVRAPESASVPMTGFGDWPPIALPATSKFYGGCMDPAAAYLYMAPYAAKHVVRVQAHTGAMSVVGSWPAGFTPPESAFIGAVCDAASVWLIPANSPALVRIDARTQLMTALDAWPQPVVAVPFMFAGAVFTGTSLWLVPSGASHAVIVEWDVDDTGSAPSLVRRSQTPTLVSRKSATVSLLPAATSVEPTTGESTAAGSSTPAPTPPPSTSMSVAPSPPATTPPPRRTRTVVTAAPTMRTRTVAITSSTLTLPRGARSADGEPPIVPADATTATATAATAAAVVVAASLSPSGITKPSLVGRGVKLAACASAEALDTLPDWPPWINYVGTPSVGDPDLDDSVARGAGAILTTAGFVSVVLVGAVLIAMRMEQAAAAATGAAARAAAPDGPAPPAALPKQPRSTALLVAAVGLAVAYYGPSVTEAAVVVMLQSQGTLWWIAGVVGLAVSAASVGAIVLGAREQRAPDDPAAAMGARAAFTRHVARAVCNDGDDTVRRLAVPLDIAAAHVVSLVAGLLQAGALAERARCIAAVLACTATLFALVVYLAVKRPYPWAVEQRVTLATSGLTLALWALVLVAVVGRSDSVVRLIGLVAVAVDASFIAAAAVLAIAELRRRRSNETDAARSSLACAEAATTTVEQPLLRHPGDAVANPLA